MSEKETLAQQAYRDVKQRILAGAFPAGDVLTERALAQESGISRTPLRAAISRLEKEGVVSRLTNGALMVRPVTVEQLLEIVQIRRLLEGAAAARAAGRSMTPALEQSARRCAPMRGEATWHSISSGSMTTSFIWPSRKLPVSACFRP
ncbi:GntR family transcriptional regulator [Rhizobium sp. RCAM05973]|uniref:GntR family transcriptional regulator n=1 Tax=Rhizobium sp. RCAM05973 TaxID=2994066 RepID=UPI0022EBAC1F|nr:GntR family transcriptional regulator [Rhizobium sp. RCAM05973]